MNKILIEYIIIMAIIYGSASVILDVITTNL